jgi:tetratricopeptide (TPR) repeat protein
VKYLGYSLLLVCMLLIVAGHWVSFPLSKGLGALSLKPLYYIRGDTHRTVASYGLLIVLALLAAAEAYRKERWKLMYAMGVLLLAVAIVGYLQIAFVTPDLLYNGLNEASWQAAANQFTHHSLPTNADIEPNILFPIPFATISGRLFSVWYLMGPGWYLAVVVAFTVIGAAARGLDPQSNLRAAVMTCLFLALLVTAFAWRPLMGERALTTAVQQEAQGHLADAQQFYWQAIKLDTWNGLDVEIYERIGALDVGLGHPGSAEAGVYQAEFQFEQGKLPEAIAIYEAILTRPGPLNRVVRDRVVQLLADYGLSLYDTGAFGTAVDAWRRALSYEPDMWLCVFYLTRGYFALGEYQQAIDVADQCLQRVVDPEFIANVYSNLGDAQTRLGAYGPGHRTYIMGYTRDYILNWRGVVSLVGE